jgi:hypothetical protein
MTILRLIIGMDERRTGDAPAAHRAGAAPMPTAPRCSARRIWHVDPEALALVTGVLLRREEIESLLARSGAGDHAGAREDALREALVQGCARPCALAEAVEHLLEGHTQALRAAVDRCPMMQIAEWWSRERDRISGEELAALLWRLASDPRPQLEPLVARVGGHLCMRALDLLREAHGATARDERRGADVGSPSGSTDPLEVHPSG